MSRIQGQTAEISLVNPVGRRAKDGVVQVGRTDVAQSEKQGELITDIIIPLFEERMYFVLQTMTHLLVENGVVAGEKPDKVGIPGGWIDH